MVSVGNDSLRVGAGHTRKASSVTYDGASGLLGGLETEMSHVSPNTNWTPRWGNCLLVSTLVSCHMSVVGKQGNPTPQGGDNRSPRCDSLDSARAASSLN